MRILYHHRTLGDGAEGVHIAAMLDAFRGLGHDVRVAALIGQQTNVATSRTRWLARVTRYLPRAAYEAIELTYTVVGHQWLNREIRRWKPAFLYERYTLFNLAGLTAARRARIPFVLEVNAPLAYERAEYERLAFKRLGVSCERHVCAKADLVVAVSTPLKEYLVRLGARPERVTVVPNAADADVFRPDEAGRQRVRYRLGIGRDEVVIGFIGILRPWHGVELLLEAVARLASAGVRPRVLIVGDGPSQKDLERVAGKLGLTDVTFAGRVAHRDIPEYVAAFDIGVSPRASFYASPMKIPEYMAAGLAVVAPRMSNIEDLIEDGTDALLFAPEDADSLASALGVLCSNAEHRRRLGAAARESVLARRTWRHNAAHLLRLVNGSRNTRQGATT